MKREPLKSSTQNPKPQNLNPKPKTQNPKTKNPDKKTQPHTRNSQPYPPTQAKAGGNDVSWRSATPLDLEGKPAIREDKLPRFYTR
jgi:hypothetical protein